jgi:hypothetical protein
LHINQQQPGRTAMMIQFVLENGDEIDININELFEELAKAGQPIVTPSGIFFPMLDFLGPVEGEMIN